MCAEADRVDLFSQNVMSEERDIGFLGPEFLGIGLFRELPAAERERFHQWLVTNSLEHHGDQYAIRDYACWTLTCAFEKVVPGVDASHV